MSQKHLDFIRIRRVPCRPGEKWLLNIPEEMSYKDAYNSCPNFLWLAWFVSLVSPSEITADYYSFLKQSYFYIVQREYTILTRQEAMLSYQEQLPDDYNNKFRQMCPWKDEWVRHEPETY